MELRVARAIDLAHATGADGGDNLVRTETRARSETHGCLNPAQFEMTVIGAVAAPSPTAFSRKRLPSDVTAYCWRRNPPCVATIRAANSETDSPLRTLPPTPRTWKAAAIMFPLGAT